MLLKMLSLLDDCTVACFVSKGEGKMKGRYMNESGTYLLLQQRSRGITWIV